jgi:hypothetical protein
MFEIEAETQEQATQQFEAFGDSIYTKELEQCNVIEEVVKGDKYARICTCCHSGMNQGYFANDEYFCSESCLRTEYSLEEWEKLYENNDDNYYWTEWEDEFDYQYQIINGELQDIEDIFNKINENLGFR